MKKSEIYPMPLFFDRYIHQVEEDDLFDAFDRSQQVLDSISIGTLKTIGHKVYAPGKWTVNDILQHIIDNERIQSYRALRIARKDATPLPGYEENDFAKHALASYRNTEEIMDELKTLRVSTIQLFRSFAPGNLKNVGTCNEKQMSVLALGFVIAGHQVHHLKVIREKYEPLIHNR